MDTLEAITHVNDYLDESGFYLLATADGKQPKCRPMRMHMLLKGRLYFGTGRFKDVFKQMQANPLVEIVAVKDNCFMRYYGTAVFEDTYDLAQAILEKTPGAKNVYTMEDDMKLEIFHLENATAEFRTMLGIEESVRFE
ncbi:pyridoxamine 5'-phosphate oxidase [Gordonibacter sp. 28C]|uniref:pyridoxamine 5'-phosphate oxidase family protein n=1 Tax=Gordonibacter sp. 28C TaxID=2078569 RepID=UPI000DF74686|nr:pyridoxamine 5'-phosphate oxidase family protein [Gordonibacter sp. 28C]RDB63112.1 pyridoxamine 5'-phosphate oxidase [Gordonibacter sp. 28C]